MTRPRTPLGPWALQTTRRCASRCSIGHFCNNDLFLTPAFSPRYLSITTPAAAVLVALALRSWRPVVTGVLRGAVVLASVPAYVGQRTPVGKPAGRDLRGVAEIMSENARPGDAFVLADDGTVSLRPRVAVAAYPAAFMLLTDVALDKTFESTGTYSDTLASGSDLAERLDHVDQLWVALPAAGGEDLVDVIRTTDLRPGQTWTVEGFTVTLWAQ